MLEDKLHKVIKLSHQHLYYQPLPVKPLHAISNISPLSQLNIVKSPNRFCIFVTWVKILEPSMTWSGLEPETGPQAGTIISLDHLRISMNPFSSDPVCFKEQSPVASTSGSTSALRSPIAPYLHTPPTSVLSSPASQTPACDIKKVDHGVNRTLEDKLKVTK